MANGLDERSVKTAWKNQGYTFGSDESEPDEVWEDEGHSCDELVMVVSGKVEVVIGDEKMVAEVGQEYLIPAKACHSIRNVGDDIATIYFGYRKKSEEILLRDYPIKGKAAAWYFRQKEISGNAWEVEGEDPWGRTIHRSGTDLTRLMEECEREAEEINKAW